MQLDLTQLSAVELAASIATRELSSTEVVTAHLDRIDDLNGRVNAIVSRRDRAAVLADAATADRTVARGPLHGLPVAVKDLADVAGLPTRSGSLVTSNEPASADGHVAAQLRAAGAIIIGKTNTPEFGTGSHTFNDVFGITRNPWNLNKTAGGSSGGAAAALAARMLPIADGTDLGGSLRNPAAMCNVVGLRPSIGRVAAPQQTSTHLRLGVAGPMGRTVADTALVLSALAGPDPHDPRARPELGSVFRAITPASNPRVAWGGDLGILKCDSDVLRICEAAARTVVGVGGTVESASPDLGDGERIFRVLRGLSYRNLGDDYDGELQAQMKATVRENIAFGRSLEIEDLLEAETMKADLHRLMSDFFDDFDVLALPTVQVPAFDVEIEYPTDIDGEPLDDYLDWMMACCVITSTECPAISIPAGFTDDGLPVGLQLVARAGHDRELLEVAAALEAANPFHHLAPAL
ncbi:MAG: amidase family protein [Acidimicrobiia bacterium]|nr:amidase family protein [Acidimicrobiia bacterium]